MRTVIVDRDYPELFGALSLLLQHAAQTRLIWDRRQQSERRSLVDIRRRLDRRRETSAGWQQHHWLTVDGEHDS